MTAPLAAQLLPAMHAPVSPGAERPLAFDSAAAPDANAAVSDALLRTIATPEDLRALPRAALRGLAAELHAFVLDAVSRTGGHLASNLGTVELAIALHFVLDTPHDRIVWDVGHQAYPHKILTGRREAMSGLRSHGGISGFPRRSESTYDTFGTAHSSTSISAALGMAVGSRLRGDARRVVAVIGDGALSAGLAFEAMNNAGTSDADLLVILNDNGMSISPAVGALDSHLNRLAASRAYRVVRKAAGQLLARTPRLRRMAHNAERHARSLVLPTTLFEQLGFAYSGPIDGHDLDALIPALSDLTRRRGPQLLHVLTRKGHGYAPAERDPVRYHGVSRFSRTQGIVDSAPSAKVSFTQVFGNWVCDMAALDPRLAAITPAMREGSGLVEFAQRYPRRYFDVGIAEQHALTFAAGLACEGMKPVVAIYSTFLQRAYDQLVHDVQLQNLPVLFAIDRAGLVGQDGATHHGAFDIVFLRCIPNLTLMTPADENELRQMLYTGFKLDAPAAVRYPRGGGSGVAVSSPMQALPLGKAQVRRRGQRAALLAFGPLLEVALAVAEALDLTVVNMRFVKPLDESLIAQVAASHELIVTLEDGAATGGAGSAVAECLARQGTAIPLLQLGLPDRFIDHGEQGELMAQAGLDRAGVLAAVTRRLKTLEPAAPRGSR